MKNGGHNMSVEATYTRLREWGLRIPVPADASPPGPGMVASVRRLDGRRKIDIGVRGHSIGEPLRRIQVEPLILPLPQRLPAMPSPSPTPTPTPSPSPTPPPTPVPTPEPEKVPA
jgi:hypothetical protein